MAEILRGAEVAQSIYSKLTARIDALKEKKILPALAVLRIGDEKDQISYLKSITKSCGNAGVEVKEIIFGQDVKQETVTEAIHKLNDDKTVHGILILRPLPGHINDNEVCTALSPDKDVDGITSASMAGVFMNADSGFAPCTAQACMEILNHYKIDCAGKRAAVVGRSLVIGRPAALMLMAADATVTVCHSKTRDIPAITQNADIVIAAIGKAESLTGEYFSSNQVIIDVGINWNAEKGKLCGDVNFDEAEPAAAAVTPVPGGVGTVTTAVLILHTVQAAERKCRK